MLRRLGDSLLVAIGFLTVLPVGGRVAEERDAGDWATAWFPVVGRWAMVLSLALATPARPTGLGARFAVTARPIAATLGTAIALGGLALLFSPGRLLAAWSLGAITASACALFLSRRFGGLTGDGYGAVGLAAELAALWAFLPLPANLGAHQPWL